MKAQIHNYLDTIKISGVKWHTVSTIKMEPNTVITAKAVLCGTADAPFSRLVDFVVSMDDEAEEAKIEIIKLCNLAGTLKVGITANKDKALVRIKGIKGISVKCACSVEVLEMKE